MSTRRRRRRDTGTRVITAKDLRLGDVILTETPSGRIHRFPVEDIERRTLGYPSGKGAVFARVEGRRDRDDRLMYCESSQLTIER